MEMRKHEFGDVPVLPGLDVSLRQQTPITPTTPPDPGLSDRLAFTHVRRACELAILHGDYQLAWRGAQSLMRRCPEALWPSMILAQALLASKQPGLSLPHFQLVINRNQLDAAAWRGLSQALQHSGHDMAASAASRRAVCNQPLDTSGVPTEAAAALPAARGMIYLRRGLADMAVVELANTMRQTPSRLDVRWAYISALWQSNRLDDARRLLSHHDFEMEPPFPLLCLRAVLSPASDVVAATREQITAMDPDGTYQQAFFAPHAVPWPLDVAPTIGWDPDMIALSEYLVATADTTLVAHGMSAPVVAPPTVSSVVTAVSAPTTRPTLPMSSSDGQVHLILGHRAALMRRFGDSVWVHIDRRLQRLVAVLRSKGMTVMAGYIDEPSGLTVPGVVAPPAVGADAFAVRDLIRGLATQLATRQSELATVILLGGDECIPFHRLQNPIPDDERVVLSDNPYACDDAGYLIPQRIVARLPEGDGSDPTLLINLLESMATYHTQATHQRRFGVDVAALLRIRNTPGRRLAVGIAADVWREPSQHILRNMHADAVLHLSPPLTGNVINPRSMAGREVIYVNLHGAAGMPHFYGQAANGWGAASALPIALSPSHFTKAVVAGTIMISEACYGAELLGRSVHNSIPLKALSEGALAFVGATVNAYGSANVPLLGADLLFDRLTHYLADGMTVGLALHFARLEFAQIMYERQGFLDDVDMKTLIEFSLLGDPWAAIKGAQLQPTISHTSSTGSLQVLTIERVPKVLRRMQLNESDISGDMLRRAKEVLHKYIPNSAATPLSIVATTNPHYQAKGLAMPDIRFSTKALWQTSDGQWLPRTAHVTLSNDSITKTVLSH